MNPKNRAIVVIPKETLLGILRREVFMESLPDDVELVVAHPDIRREGLLLLLRSSSFPPIAEGAQIPEISPKLITRAAFAERMAYDLTALTDKETAFEPGPIAKLAAHIAESIGGVA